MVPSRGSLPPVTVGPASYRKRTPVGSSKIIARSFAHSSPRCEPMGVILTFCARAGNAASKRANAGQAIFTVPPETFHSRLAGRRATATVCDCSRSVVKFGSDLALNPRSVIVLDPQLRVILFHEFFDHLAALRSLLLVGVEGRNFLQRDLLRIVIEIARQKNVTGFGKL